MLLLLLSIFATVLTNDICMDSKKVKSFLKSEPADLESSILNVSISLDISSLTVSTYLNRLEIEATVTREWSVPDYFGGKNICNDLSITRLKSLIPVPQIGYTNAVSVSVSSHSTRIKVKQDGTFVHQEKFKQTVPCTTNSSLYPFGNTTCKLVWHIDDSLGFGSEYHWNEIKIHGNESGDVWFRSFDSLGDEAKIQLLFNFVAEKAKFYLSFVVPLSVFVSLAWTSLLLGPMVITRTLLNTMSLVLCMMLFLTNTFGTYDTLSLNLIDVYKTFGFSFVAISIMELILVTLLTSLGNARCFRRNTKKYETEPLYEEMNDLRGPNAPKSTGFCGWLACILDISTLVGLAVYAVTFIVYAHIHTQWLIKTFANFPSDILNLF